MAVRHAADVRVRGVVRFLFASSQIGFILAHVQTVALGYSAFCDLFTEEEWKGYEYSVGACHGLLCILKIHILADLSFWYNNGPGNPAVAAQGIGWVQELVSRLTQTRITEFASSVNGTIVSSNVTFPLSQPIFVDATHDTVISASTSRFFHY